MGLKTHLARLVANASLRLTAAPLPSFPPAWMRRGGWLWAVLATSVHVVRGLEGRIT